MLDLASVDRQKNAVVILPGEGDGTFSSPAYLMIPNGAPRTLALGDVIGNTIDDLVVIDSGMHRFWILEGQGNGKFGDDQDDLVAIREGQNGLAVFLANEDGTFPQEPELLPAVGYVAANLLLADVIG